MRPSARVAAALVGDAFVYERGVGYVNGHLHTAIVPACAGVNFLVIAACTLVLGFVARVDGRLAKVGFVLASGAAAYVTTLMVNGCRIAAGIALREAPLFRPWASGEAAHRALGVALYLGSLFMLCEAATRVLPAGEARP
jgi:exosortase K